MTPTEITEAIKVLTQTIQVNSTDEVFGFGPESIDVVKSANQKIIELMGQYPLLNEVKN